MNEGQINGRLSWLGAALAARRNSITDIISRLRGMAVRVGTSLALHRKFLHFMDQVAADREKELDILHEIETVEKRHRELKHFGLLRHADPDAKEKQKPDILEDDENEDEDGPERFSLLEIFAFFALFSRLGFKKPEPNE